MLLLRRTLGVAATAAARRMRAPAAAAFSTISVSGGGGGGMSSLFLLPNPPRSAAAAVAVAGGGGGRRCGQQKNGAAAGRGGLFAAAAAAASAASYCAFMSTSASSASSSSSAECAGAASYHVAPDERRETEPVTGMEYIVSSPRESIYPAIEPYRTGTMRVGKGGRHAIYWEECGNPNGKPVIFVHGGPGGGCSPSNRRYFDPAVYRIILFDQRGCGRSTPHADLDQSTWDLVADMEQLREELGISKWQLFGGSWGSCLSLSYAIKHPDRVTELVLRGIFTLRDEELKFFYQEGASFLRPEAWEIFMSPIPEKERDDYMMAYHKRLTGDNTEEKLEAARAWTTWEMCTCTIEPSVAAMQRGSDDFFALAFARIENHYFVNKGFFEHDGWIMDNAHVLANIPTTIVHGRYDVVCAVKNAWDLKKRIPHAKLVIVPDAGHSISEPGVGGALLRATELYKHNRA